MATAAYPEDGQRQTGAVPGTTVELASVAAHGRLGQSPAAAAPRPTRPPPRSGRRRAMPTRRRRRRRCRRSAPRSGNGSSGGDGRRQAGGGGMQIRGLRGVGGGGGRGSSVFGSAAEAAGGAGSCPGGGAGSGRTRGARPTRGPTVGRVGRPTTADGSPSPVADSETGAPGVGNVDVGPSEPGDQRRILLLCLPLHGRQCPSSSSGVIRTLRAFDPSEGPTTPRRSMRSISRPARANPTRSLRCSIEVDPSCERTTRSMA